MMDKPKSEPGHDHEVFYKYVTGEKCIRILRELKLQWSSPIVFNDLFDVKEEIDFGFDVEELRQPLTDEYKKLILNPDIPVLYGNERYKQAIILFRKLATEDQKTHLLEILDSIADQSMQQLKQSMAHQNEEWQKTRCRFRILCLAEMADNTLMWSHYADDNRGAVICLKCIPEIDNAILAATPITYESPGSFLLSKEDWVKHLTGQIPLQTDNIFNKMVYRKGTEWAYEREWRLIWMAEDNPKDYKSLYPILPCEIDSVILGARMPGDQCDAVKDILRSQLTHVKLFKAVPDYYKKTIDIRAVDGYPVVAEKP